MSKIDDMNDPYEWKSVRSYDEASQRALDRTGSETVEKYSALCFSRSWNSILMWSHYGDRHRGICLGFDVPDEFARNVKYLENPEMLGDISTVSDEEGLRILDLLFGAKYDGWRYEKEVRVNASRQQRDEETGQYFVAFGERLVLKEVIAGVRFPYSRRPIDEALKGYPENVKIAKAVRSAEKFDIILDLRGFDKEPGDTLNSLSGST